MQSKIAHLLHQFRQEICARAYPTVLVTTDDLPRIKKAGKH